MVHEIKISMKGLDKHQLVCVDMLSVPRNVRKIYGMALDKNQENLFKKLGFKLEAKIPNAAPKAKLAQFEARFAHSGQANGARPRTEKIYSRFFK